MGIIKSAGGSGFAGVMAATDRHYVTAHQFCAAASGLGHTWAGRCGCLLLCTGSCCECEEWPEDEEPCRGPVGIDVDLNHQLVVARAWWWRLLWQP